MTDYAKKVSTVDDLIAQAEGTRVELINGKIVPKEAVSFEHSERAEFDSSRD